MANRSTQGSNWWVACKQRKKLVEDQERTVGGFKERLKENQSQVSLLLGDGGLVDKLVEASVPERRGFLVFEWSLEMHWATFFATDSWNGPYWLISQFPRISDHLGRIERCTFSKQ